jgi:hypothetical protein
VSGITSGGDVVGSGLGLVVLASIGAAVALLNERFVPRWACRRGIRIWNRSFVVVLSIVGLVAILVGLVMLATGTTFS